MRPEEAIQRLEQELIFYDGEYMTVRRDVVEVLVRWLILSEEYMNSHNCG